IAAMIRLIRHSVAELCRFASLTTSPLRSAFGILVVVAIGEALRLIWARSHDARIDRTHPPAHGRRAHTPPTSRCPGFREGHAERHDPRRCPPGRICEVETLLATVLWVASRLTRRRVGPESADLNLIHPAAPDVSGLEPEWIDATCRIIPHVGVSIQF